MKKWAAVLIVLCVSVSACSIPANLWLKLTPDEEAYLARAMAQPLTFSVKPEDSDRLWKMAEAFVEKYASMKIERVSDVAIETYNPLDNRFGYRIIRTPKRDGDEISISCLCTMFDEKAAAQNAHILAHYLLTEELAERLINR